MSEALENDAPSVEPFGGRGERPDSILEGPDPYHRRADARLLESAILNDWDIPAEVYANWPKVILQIVMARTADGKNYLHTARDRIAAIRVMGSLNKQKQDLLALALKERELDQGLGVGGQPTSLMQLIIHIEEGSRANVVTDDTIDDMVARALEHQQCEGDTESEEGDGEEETERGHEYR